MHATVKARGLTLALSLVFAVAVSACTSTAQLSDAPDTPFKLATIEAGGAEVVGMVLGDQILELTGASDHLVAEAGVDPMTVPSEMRALIESWEMAAPRIAYTTSILTLQHPGDVIATGTPSGTGAERGEFVGAGDVVEIEIEGIGRLTTPIEDYPGCNSGSLSYNGPVHCH